jgi:hypothetical protein
MFFWSFLSCMSYYIYIPGVFYFFVGSPRINRIEFDIPSTVVIQDKGILNITAHIIAFPKPEMYWQFGQNGSYMNVSSGITNSFNINRQSSNLVKSNLTEEDFWTYSVYAYNGVGSTHYLLHSVVVVPASKYITINTCNYVWVWYYMLYLCLDCTSVLDSVNSKGNVMIHVSPCSFEWYEVLQDDNNESGLLLHNSWRIFHGEPVLSCHCHIQWWPLVSFLSILYSTSDDKVISSFIPPWDATGHSFLHRSVLPSVFSIVCPPVLFWIPCYNSCLPWLLLHVVANTKQVKFDVEVYSFYDY